MVICVEFGAKNTPEGVAPRKARVAINSSVGSKMLHIALDSR